MPCYVTGTAEGDARLNAEENAIEALEATRAACELWRAAKFLKYSDALSERLSPQTKEWLKKHEEIDAKRKRK